jgi:2-polyprenyl-3-methyl-5-hydroxy-6-metoxy-1,4-benzoquinol methylase
MSTEWNDYNTWNKRDESHSSLWIQPFVEYILDNYQNKIDAKILDFGCGYFETGESLSRYGFNVDGYDQHSPTIASAKTKLGKSTCSLYTELCSIPDSSYDVIICNSVFQYFSDLEMVEETIYSFLKKGKGQAGFEIIVSDLIPKSYNPYLDALESLYYTLSKRRSLLPQLKQYSKFFIKKDKLELLRLDYVELEKVFIKQGFSVRKLERNLTPSKRRYTIKATLGTHL